MNEMNRKGFKVLGVALLFCLLAVYPKVGIAQEFQTITLEEALKQTFEYNISHSLFIREQELAEKREKLESHPSLSAEINPSTIKNGVWENPEGSITMKLPLGDSLDLSSTLKMEFSKNGVGVIPAGSLGLDYSFFKLSENTAMGVSAEEDLRAQTNSLILQTVDLFIQLQQKLDLSVYEVGRQRLMEEKLWAAQQTPNYDDLSLKKELRAQASLVRQIEEELAQLQFNLATLLGASTTTIYRPVFTMEDLELSYVEEDLMEEVLLTSTNVRLAREKLELAQNKLDLEKKSRGWDLKATGKVSLDRSWDIGLTATKALYPQTIIVEELELAVAKAEHALEVEVRSVQEQIRSNLHSIQSAQNNLEMKGEHLAEAYEDLLLCQRQFEAGLITELQLKDAQLAFEKAEYDYAHSQQVRGRSILELWRLCGRDLRGAILEIIH